MLNNNPKYVFHGGCLGCSMQEQHGLGYCTGCQYFELNMSLPNLNDAFRKRQEYIEAIRNRARAMAEEDKKKGG